MLYCLGAPQESYSTVNFRGQPISLAEVYNHHRPGAVVAAAATAAAAAVAAAAGADRTCERQVQPSARRSFAFPAGTGDCCAPKLLHAAARRGLHPHSLVEFWYGAPPNTATKQGRHSPEGSQRVHKHAYGMCERCRQILGSMLCGVPSPGPT